MCVQIKIIMSMIYLLHCLIDTFIILYTCSTQLGKVRISWALHKVILWRVIYPWQSLLSVWRLLPRIVSSVTGGWPCYSGSFSLGSNCLATFLLGEGVLSVTQAHLSWEGATQGHNQLIKMGSLSHMAIKKVNHIILNNSRTIFISSY